MALALARRATRPLHAVAGTVPAPARVTEASGAADLILSREFGTAMERGLARTRAPGAQAAVRRDGALLWSAAAGRLSLADTGDGRTVPGRVGRGDRFVIASATKLVVACAAMSMAERGDLDLDAPVGRWLPALPNADRVTVRMLLSHRSGLPEYFRDRELARRMRDEPLRPWDRREVLEAVARLGPEAEPGVRHAYTNSNYVALGEILERQAGEGVERLVRGLISEPLGLETLSFAGELPGGSRLASPHVALLGRVFDPLRRTGGRVPTDAVGEVWTDGGLASSAEDLSAFTDALFGGRLLRPETVAEMTSAPVGGYGLGVAVWERRGARLLGHNGMYLGWSSVATFDARSRVTVSVLTNLAGTEVAAERVEGALRGVLD